MLEDWNDNYFQQQKAMRIMAEQEEQNSGSGPPTTIPKETSGSNGSVGSKDSTLTNTTAKTLEEAELQISQLEKAVGDAVKDRDEARSQVKELATKLASSDVKLHAQALELQKMKKKQAEDEKSRAMKEAAQQQADEERDEKVQRMQAQLDLVLKRLEEQTPPQAAEEHKEEGEAAEAGVWPPLESESDRKRAQTTPEKPPPPKNARSGTPGFAVGIGKYPYPRSTRPNPSSRGASGPASSGFAGSKPG
jgi:septal ring factor EnvC (AmiA/AmiB activator)